MINGHVTASYESLLPTTFVTGIYDDEHRTGMINAIYDHLTEAMGLTTNERYLFMATAKDELNDALGADAHMMTRRYGERTLEQRADLAIAETAGKIVRYRKMVEVVDG